MEQLLSGLQLLASHNLYHADVVRPYTQKSPWAWVHNVMRHAPSGTIKIIDMGEVYALLDVGEGGGGGKLPRWERGCGGAAEQPADAGGGRGGGGGGGRGGGALGESWEDARRQRDRGEKRRMGRATRRLSGRDRLAGQQSIWLGKHVEACDWNPNKVVS